MKNFFIIIFVLALSDLGLSRWIYVNDPAAFDTVQKGEVETLTVDEGSKEEEGRERRSDEGQEVQKIGQISIRPTPVPFAVQAQEPVAQSVAIPHIDPNICGQTGTKVKVWFAHPTRCDKYMECVAGTPVVRDCGSDTYWNPKKRNCGAWEDSYCATVMKIKFPTAICACNDYVRVSAEPVPPATTRLPSLPVVPALQENMALKPERTRDPTIVNDISSPGLPLGRHQPTWTASSDPFSGSLRTTIRFSNETIRSNKTIRLGQTGPLKADVWSVYSQTYLQGKPVRPSSPSGPSLQQNLNLTPYGIRNSEVVDTAASSGLPLGSLATAQWGRQEHLSPARPVQPALQENVNIKPGDLPMMNPGPWSVAVDRSEPPRSSSFSSTLIIHGRPEPANRINGIRPSFPLPNPLPSNPNSWSSSTNIFLDAMSTICTHAASHLQMKFSHPTERNKYILCDQLGRPVIKECEPGTYWDNLAKACTPSQRNNCFSICRVTHHCACRHWETSPGQSLLPPSHPKVTQTPIPTIISFATTQPGQSRLTPSLPKVTQSPTQRATTSPGQSHLAPSLPKVTPTPKPTLVTTLKSTTTTKEEDLEYDEPEPEVDSVSK